MLVAKVSWYSLDLTSSGLSFLASSTLTPGRSIAILKESVVSCCSPLSIFSAPAKSPLASNLLAASKVWFANIVFCKRNTKIIELKTQGTSNLYKNIALSNNLKYYGIKSVIRDKVNNQNGIIDININKLKKII